MRKNLLLILLTISHGLSGQCMSKEVFWEILDLKSFSWSDPRRLQYLNTLKKNARNCGFVNDSLDAKLNRVIGESFLELQLLDSARYYTRNAIVINSTHAPAANPMHNIVCYYNLALIEKSQNRYEDALNALNQCIILARNQAGMTDYITRAYGEIARLHYDRGSYLSGRRESQPGVPPVSGSELPKKQIDVIYQQAEAYNDQQDQGMAEQLISALTGLVNPSSPSLSGYIYSAIADLRARQARYPEAIQAYQRALYYYDLSAEENNQYAEVSLKLGNLFLTLKGDKSLPLHHFKEAYKRATNHWLKAEASQKIAGINARLKNWDKALEFYQQTLTLLVPGFNPTSLSANPSLNQLRRNISKPDIVRVMTEKGRVLLDSIRAGNINSDLRDMTASFALQSFRSADSLLHYMLWQYQGDENFWQPLARPVYAKALELCHLANRPEEALFFIERGKYVQLRSRISEHQVTSVLHPGELEQYHQFSREIARLERIIRQQKVTDRDISNFSVNLLRSYENRERIVIERLSEIPYFKHLVIDRSITNVNRLRQDLLSPMQGNGAYLTYYEGEDWLYGLLISPENLQLRKLPLKIYQRLAPRYMEYVSRKDLDPDEFSRFLPISHALYKVLFEPFPIALEHRIIVSPAREFLPFEAFSRSMVQPEYLVNNFAFSYTYSSAYVDHGQSVRKTFPFYKTYYGLFPQETQPQDYESLLGSCFLTPTVRSGSAASVQNFLDHAPYYRVVQLESAKIDQGIILADSSLTMDRLYNHPFKTQLLVLSSGDSTESESRVVELSRQFMNLGISSVLACLWNDGERMFARQGLAFYNHLRFGTPLDIALQNTKKELLDNGNLYQPGKWAGMILIGSTVPVATNKEIYWGLTLGLGIFLLTLYTTFIYQKRKRKRIARLRKIIAQNQEP